MQTVIKNRFTSNNENLVKNKIVQSLILVSSLVLLTLSVKVQSMLFSFIAKSPEIMSVTPEVGKIGSFATLPLTIKTDVPIQTEKLQIHSSPSIDLSFSVKKEFWILPVSRYITITSNTILAPNTPIMIYLSNISNPLNKSYGGEYLIEFTTNPIAEIIASNIKDGQTNVPLTNTVNLDLSDTPLDNILWSASIEPNTGTMHTKLDKNVLRIESQTPLIQNTNYSLFIFAEPVDFDRTTNTILQKYPKQLHHTLSFKTVKSPLVSSFTPQSSQTHKNDPIILEFDEPIQEKSLANNYSISPSVRTSASWDHTMTKLTIAHEDFTIDTNYTFTLLKGLQTIHNGSLDQPLQFHFKTIGPLSVISSNPATNEQHVSPKTRIQIQFDQSFNGSLIDKYIAISPYEQFMTNSSGSLLTIIPKQQLQYKTKYTVTLAQGIPSLEGLPNSNPIVIDFTTESEEFALPIQYLRQEENFTCNIAAARMALNYRNFIKTEKELKLLTGTAGVRGSGNPHKGYTDLYGTYWEPIQQLIEKFTKTKLYSQVTLVDILKEVQNNNPVIVWSQNGWSDPHEISWKTATGEQIFALNGMHSYLVRGFTGPIESPSQILVHDPWRGTYAMSTEKFTQLLDFFNVALAVY